MNKEEIIKEIEQHKPTQALNLMGCSENWYDTVYAMKRTFTIEDIKKYIDKNITSKEYITYIDEKKGRAAVINLKNVFRVEFEEVKGDD